MNTQPAITIGAITTAVAALMAALVAFGIDLTKDQQIAVLGIIAGVGPLVAGLITHTKVWAPANVAVAKVDGGFVSGPAAGISEGKPVAVTPVIP